MADTVPASGVVGPERIRGGGGAVGASGAVGATAATGAGDASGAGWTATGTGVGTSSSTTVREVLQPPKMGVRAARMRLAFRLLKNVACICFTN
jgi:hypothetical protein